MPTRPGQAHRLRGRCFRDHDESHTAAWSECLPLRLPVSQGKAIDEADPAKKQKARTAEQGQRQVRTPVGVIPCRSFRSDRGRGCVSPKIQPLGLVEMVTSAGERFQLLGRR